MVKYILSSLVSKANCPCGWVSASSVGKPTTRSFTRPFETLTVAIWALCCAYNNPFSLLKAISVRGTNKNLSVTIDIFIPTTIRYVK